MMSSSNQDGFSFRERILVAPLLSTRSTTDPFLQVRLESAMTVHDKDDDISVTPFPRQARELLQRHNASRILIQVGTSSSHTFGGEGQDHPLDAVDPWQSSDFASSSSSSSTKRRRRLDLGPSGVLVRATLQLSTPTGLTPAQCQALLSSNNERNMIQAWGGHSQVEALLHDLVARRIVLAPLVSVSIRRLHRHSLVSVVACRPSVMSSSDDATLTSTGEVEIDYELVLPTEGAALSSEGMHAFATTFAPCHNQSGIFSWNDPKTMSEIFVKRESTARHSWWMQLEQNRHERVVSIVKGMQFQPRLVESPAGTKTAIATKDTPSRKHRTVSLADLFPSSTRHRRCPFVQESTLETVVVSSDRIQMTPLGNEQQPPPRLLSDHPGTVVQVQALTPKYWKDPWMTLLPPTPDEPQPQQPSRWSVHQTLQRPRGVAYSGRLITQVVVHPSTNTSSHNNDDRNQNNCHVAVDLQWFLPPVVQPTWQSLRVVWEQAHEQVEQELEWKRDLDGQIDWINQQPGDDGTIHFRIPRWNVTTTSTTSDSPQTLTVYLDYRPAFLSFEHFPGDANRGVEIPPAMASFVATCQPSQHPSPPILLYSNSLLLLPPVPDMSMPFNVLSMTCSLYAFIIGSLLNLLIRKSSERVQRTYDPSKVPPPNKLQQLKAKIVDKVKSFRKGKPDADAQNDSTKAETKGDLGSEAEGKTDVVMEEPAGAAAPS